MQALFKSKKLKFYSVWFVVLSFVLTIFLVWGIGDKVSTGNFVASVNGKKISYEEFNQSYDRTVESFKPLFGDNLDKLKDSLGIEALVLNSLVNRKLLLAEAERLNIPVSDTEVISALSGITAFQKDGQFDVDTYRKILASNRISPTAFEAGVREDLVQDKLKNIIKSSVNITDLEINEEYNFRHSKASIEYLKIDPKEYEKDVAFDDAKLKAFYDENKASYSVAPEIAVKYVVLAEEDFDPEVAVTDSEVEAYYVKNKDSFQEKEKVKASHIIILVDDWNSKPIADAALNKITDIKKKLDAGGDFAALAKEHSMDGSSQSGGDLGYFYKGQMVKEFEEKAFGGKTGEISDVFKTQYGYHILKVTDHQEAKKFSFDEVKDKIKTNIVAERKNTLFRNYVMSTYRDIVKASNITAYNASAEKKLLATKTDFFNMDTAPKFFAANPKALSGLFTLNKSEISQIVNLGGKAYVFEVADKKPSYIQDFDEVKEEVQKSYVVTESLKLAEKAAADAAKEGSMDKAAEKLAKTFTTTPPFKRDDVIPGIGFLPELANEIFKSKSGKFLEKGFTGQDSVFLVRVKEKIEADPKGLDTYASDIKEFVLVKKRDAALDSYLERLREKAEIIFSKEFAEKLKQ